MEVKIGYKHTEAGIIPEDWEIKDLGSLLKICHGKPQKEVEDSNGKYPILGTGGLMGFANDFLYDKESVLIGRKGTIDKPQYMSTPFWTVDTLFYSKINKGIVPKVIYYNFLLIDWYSHNEASGVPSLNASKIEKIKIPLPPTEEEQQTIASALNDVDTLLTKLEALIAKKKAIKQGAMQQLLTPPNKGGKRLPGFDGEWEEKDLGSLIVGNPVYGINAAAVKFNENLPKYLRITDISDSGSYIKENKVSVNDESSENFVLEEGELVFARTGASVGKTYLYDVKDGVLVFAGFLIKVRPDEEKLNSKYLKAFTQTKKYASWVNIMSMRSGQPGINGNEYASLKIPLPSRIEEQNAIADIFSDMDADIEQLEAKKKKYQCIKQGMMQELLTGKTRLV